MYITRCLGGKKSDRLKESYLQQTFKKEKEKLGPIRWATIPNIPVPLNVNPVL